MTDAPSRSRSGCDEEEPTDRITNDTWETLDSIGSIADYGVFGGGATNWQNLQENIAEDLDMAVVTDPIEFRPDYDQVQAVLDGEADISTLEGCD